MKRCSECFGTGKVRVHAHGALPQIPVYAACGACGGTGKKAKL